MLPRHLYVHVPFCARRCVYCDFSIAVRRVTPVDDYIDGLTRELTAFRATPINGDAWTLDTLYLGGGTPSRLGGDGIARVIDTIDEFAALRAGAEVTIETNPEDVSAEAARSWKTAGINRISIGAQSFDDNVLRWMHRVHNADAIRIAAANARGAGFDNISLDLIFALPESVERSWTRDLDETVAIAPQHVSLYGLTIEHASPLGRTLARDPSATQSEDRYACDFLHAHERMTAAGFDHYEVSNFSQPGFRSRHNSAYWSGKAYLGVGPAAHSFDGETRSWNVPYVEWLDRLRGGSSPVAGSERLTRENHRAEAIYLGLRTAEGYKISDRERDVAALWQSAGWGSVSDSTLRLSAEGWLRLDSLASGLTVS